MGAMRMRSTTMHKWCGREAKRMTMMNAAFQIGQINGKQIYKRSLVLAQLPRIFHEWVGGRECVHMVSLTIPLLLSFHLVECANNNKPTYDFFVLSSRMHIKWNARESVNAIRQKHSIHKLKRKSVWLRWRGANFDMCCSAASTRIHSVLRDRH